MEDLSDWNLTDDEAWEVIHETRGSVLAWSTRDGSAAASWVSQVIIDDGIYFPMVEGRGKTYALRRDPRATLVFVSDGAARSVTARGHVEFMDDARWVTRWCLAAAIRSGMSEAAKAQFLRQADSARRIVVRFHPRKFITFDISKVVRD
jgi:hypothetical protein